jgi:hypothetical protein
MKLQRRTVPPAVAHLVLVRRMMRIALLLSLVCASATASAGESPGKVTVQQLLAAPQKFVGKRVDVTGWYSVHAEDSQLYASSRAMSSGTIDDSQSHVYGAARNGADDPPRLAVEEIAEILDWPADTVHPLTGFALYDQGT